MTSVMDDYLDSPMDQDDIFPCKGCGELPTGQVPERTPAESGKDSLSLPQASYRNNRNSSIFMPSDAAGGDAEAFFIPVALDPGPAPTPDRQLSKKDNRDYFSPVKSSSESKAESAATTPHIAFQEKGRQSSSEDAKVRPPGRRLSKSSRKDSGTPNSKSAEEPLPPRTSSKAPITTDDFKLQDAPVAKIRRLPHELAIVEPRPGPTTSR
ncbi:unnamed protein product [Parascedosporium putredinis]|uniref:Uncharacterized protein n=1 Tax=Parascedosporium putredinis TaxID=1442378 RepID=A0A9P1MD16_9PEZI|nr:unnamed protein product [Parascedosporium putredinis]CAI7998795.1 unnamed protein product [Parascedosporium putredinis]